MLSDALRGVRVIDLSRLLPGPFCSLLLADMGADVIKIEAPEGGDYARYYPPLIGDQGALFASINRNKRSVSLQLKDPRARELLLQLIEGADVVLETFRPGVMARLGLDADSLRARNPALILCAISAYGQDGPLVTRAGHDLNCVARSGALDQLGHADGPPMVPGVQLADLGSGLYAALGIVSALLRRERTGQGASLDISMTEAALSFVAPLITGVAATGQAPQRGAEQLSGGAPAYQLYETLDGGFIAVGALEPKFWLKLLDAIGAPELGLDGVDTGPPGQLARAKLAAIFKQRTRDDWDALLAPLDVCCEPVLRPDEVLDSALMRARDAFFTLAGATHTRTPITARDMAHRAPPGLGEHTDEVLTSLGVDPATLATLRAEGAI